MPALKDVLAAAPAESRLSNSREAVTPRPPRWSHLRFRLRQVEPHVHLAVSRASPWPHFRQNLAPGRLGSLQLGQTLSSFAPHSSQ